MDDGRISWKPPTTVGLGAVTQSSWVNEKVRDTDEIATPDVEPVEHADGFRVVPLECLVRLKLTSFQRKEQVHLEDMIDVELIDTSWTGRLEPVLTQRLQHLFDNLE